MSAYTRRLETLTDAAHQRHDDLWHVMDERGLRQEFLDIKARMREQWELEVLGDRRKNDAIQESDQERSETAVGAYRS